MNIKSTIAGVAAILMVASVIPSQAWAKHCCCKDKCSGVGWHMVADTCPFIPAITWQQYYSGGYLPPVAGSGFLFLR